MKPTAADPDPASRDEARTQCSRCIAFRESGEYGFRWCYQHRAEFELRLCSSYHPKRS